MQPKRFYRQERIRISIENKFELSPLDYAVAMANLESDTATPRGQSRFESNVQSSAGLESRAGQGQNFTYGSGPVNALGIVCSLGNTNLVECYCSITGAIPIATPQSGASVPPPGPMGFETALLLCAVNQPDILKLLLEHHANTSLTNNLIHRLMLAAQIGQTNSIRLLAQAGADMNARDTKGPTALHYAFSGRHCESVPVLLECKADPNVRDLAEDTPLDFAAGRSNVPDPPGSAYTSKRLDPTSPTSPPPPRCGLMALWTVCRGWIGSW
ncbi:MAG: ankyrin repeat domain-containing protein [Verrucomicrobiota bacterium]